MVLYSGSATKAKVSAVQIIFRYKNDLFVASAFFAINSTVNIVGKLYCYNTDPLSETLPSSFDTFCLLYFHEYLFCFATTGSRSLFRYGPIYGCQLKKLALHV